MIRLHLTFILLIVFSSNGMAKYNNAQSWAIAISQTKIFDKLKRIMPLEFLIVKDLQPAETPLQIPIPSSENLFFRFAPAVNVLFSFRLNGYHRNLNGKRSLSQTAARLLPLSHANFIVIAQPEGNWPVLQIFKNKVHQSGTFKPISEEAQATVNWGNWVSEQLGYNGVVIAEDKNTLLVYTHRNVLSSSSQAIVFHKSQTKVVLSEEAQANGSGLLAMTSQYKNFAIFRPLLSLNRASIGDKVFVSP